VSPATCGDRSGEVLGYSGLRGVAPPATRLRDVAVEDGRAEIDVVTRRCRLWPVRHDDAAGHHASRSGTSVLAWCRMLVVPPDRSMLVAEVGRIVHGSMIVGRRHERSSLEPRARLTEREADQGQRHQQS
jgi:hypothetical protein